MTATEITTHLLQIDQEDHTTDRESSLIALVNSMSACARVVNSSVRTGYQRRRDEHPEGRSR